jgi:hypothetical protein
MASWQPYEVHGHLTERSDLPDSVFAFPRERKEPLTDAAHVRNAIARFDQVIDVSDEDREEALENIRAAAQYYGVDISESDEQLLARQNPRTAAERRESARVGAATREREREDLDLDD